jgi:hypothetical protein
MKTKAERIAKEAIDHFAAACGDMASNDLEADQLYSDEATASDVIGQYIFDECRRNYILMIVVAQNIVDSKYIHDGIKNAMKKKIKTWGGLLK